MGVRRKGELALGSRNIVVSENEEGSRKREKNKGGESRIFFLRSEATKSVDLKTGIKASGREKKEESNAEGKKS